MIDRALGLGLLTSGAVTCAAVNSCLLAGYVVGIVTVFAAAAIIGTALGGD
ncbi:MAG: hypothetical protein WCC90_07340 [Methylocella sp.]